jgi:hypothetical protein
MATKPLRLTEFVVGDVDFRSTGVSRLVVTKDGHKGVIEIPIKSVGVIEMDAALAAKRPEPPVKLEEIDGKTVRVYDHTDPAYRAAVDAWADDRAWAMIIAGLDVRFVGADGLEITDPKKIVQALKSAGITGGHRDRLTADIRSLTAEAEASADFLSGEPAGSTTRPSKR